MSARAGRRRSSRRGGALVLVLIFAAGGLMLASTMLSLSRSHVVQERDQHRDRQLRGVLEAAIAAAVNEINMARQDGAVYVDPEGNGPGALGGADREGLALLGPDGRSLGRYRAVVERATTRYGAPKDVLVVAAADPDFQAPGARIIAAEVDLVRQPLPLGANPLSITGEYEHATKLFVMDPSSDAAVSAPLGDVPAVNVGSPTLHADFVADVAPRLAVLAGGDPANPGTLVSGAATVSNVDGGLVTAETLSKVRANLNAFVASASPGATQLKASSLVPGGTLTLPRGVYRISTPMDLSGGTRIQGSGTLIIEHHLHLKVGGGLDWDGDVIVVEDKDSHIEVQTGAALAQRGGVLAVVSEDAATRVTFKPASSVAIGTPAAPSAFVLIAGTSSDDLKLEFKDLDMTVHGLIAAMATHKLEVKLDSGNVNVVGSLAMVMAEPEDERHGHHHGPHHGPGHKHTELKLELKKGSYLDLSFDRATFDAALDRLGLFLDPRNELLPMKVTTYWERRPADVLATQESVMARPMAGWGMP